jgi:hypothetical protein
MRKQRYEEKMNSVKDAVNNLDLKKFLFAFWIL